MPEKVVFFRPEEKEKGAVASAPMIVEDKFIDLAE
jgi:hypothetical protein